jgi:glutathione S-transferase
MVCCAWADLITRLRCSQVLGAAVSLAPPTGKPAMALTLYLHPLSSFCHKVLIALYENGTPFRAETINFGDAQSTGALREKWPLGKIPVLHDGGRDRNVAETSIMIEYLQIHYPGPVRLLPDDAEACLHVRLWDRFFDLYVSAPMQRIVAERLRPDDAKDEFGVAEARRTLDTAYVMIERQAADDGWIAGGQFSLADCAAAPALFYGSIVHPFGAQQTRLRGYFERLLARPSVRRVLAEARPYFTMFPYRQEMPKRFVE